MIKICPNCNQEYEAKTEDSKICFDCFKELNNLRQIERNEIIIDTDNTEEQGCRCVSATGISLVNEGYHIELWYANGQKQPHIHIKDIPHIADLPDKQLKEYKRLFLQKYISIEFWNDKIPDYSLCDIGHLIAEENKPHFKYKTLKTLRSEFNIDKQNFCDIKLFNQVKEIEEYKPQVTGTGITARIVQVISIKDIARQFGLQLEGNKTLCPFHPDNNTPSLVFYEQQGRYCCFGCNAKGNLIDFYARLKELNPNFKYHKEKSND